jgi:UDP-N-acetylmuramyl pentapeptide phosphotransferase/UDP-N-acetylglucosamine-1-phosphate transferase
MISWIDDLVSVSFIWRFPVHSVAALIVILELGYWHQIYLPFLGVFDLGLWGSLVTFCWIVWVTNAFNFMDGIDGIAGLQAVTAGIGWLVVGTMIGVDSTALYGGIIAFASLGFLIHNWQPAKIFMGDVGSAYLGFSFAVLPLLPSDNSDPLLPTISILLVFCFLFDTLFTFAKRLFKRERVWEAHQQHIYQRLIFLGYSHKQVSIFYGIISLSVGISAAWMIFLNR